MSTSGPGGPVDPRRLRVGDHDREQAAAALGEHYALGRLSDVEHGERLDAVWSARTRADLEVLFHDLPTQAGVPATAGGVVPSTRRGGLPTPVVVTLVVLAVLALGQVPWLLILAIVVLFVVIKRQRRRVRRQHAAQHPGWS